MNFEEQIDYIGDNHIITSVETPLREDAFELSDQEKIEKIKQKMGEIIEILGLDLTDESLKGTPLRVAKMYVKEIFSGLDPKKKPKVNDIYTHYFHSFRKIMDKLVDDEINKRGPNP